MKQRSKLFAPIFAALIGTAAIATYQISRSDNGSAPSLLADDALAVESLSTAGVINAPLDSKPATDFLLKDVNGKLVKVSDYKGKVVVLNFWATWCPPCRREIPDFNELQAQYGSQGIQFLGIALDDEGVEKVKSWMTTNPVSYPVLIPDNTIVAKYGEMSAIPVTFVIDRQGNIRTSYVGMRKKEALEGMIKPLLASQ